MAAFELLLRRATSLSRRARWARLYPSVGVAETAEAVLQRLHAVADAVATASPGHSGGAILHGLNSLSRGLWSLAHDGESASASPSSERREREGEWSSGEADGVGGGWSDSSGLSWARDDEVGGSSEAEAEAEVESGAHSPGD